MPFSPTPNHPLTLPRTILTIPAAKNPLRLTQIPHLKIGITPHVVVPVPLISERAIGRALDDCVDMIVPVGGRVAIAVNVETGVLLGLDASCEDELVVEEEVKNRVRETTTRNKGPLGLQSAHFLPPTGSVSPIPSDSSPTSASILLDIHPLTACSSRTPLTKHLIPSGMPIAYLSRLDFHFRWAIPLPNPVDYSKALNAGGREVGWTKESQDADKNGEYLVNDDDDNLLEEDDESLTVVDDDEEDMLEDDVQREEGAGSQGLHDAEIQEEHQRSSLPAYDGPFPEWATYQLKTGLRKLITTRMIKRFPLIFDAGLHDYSPSLSVPRSITSALAHFLSSSANHKTALLKAAKIVLRNIAVEQDTRLLMKIDQATQMPARARFPKKCRMGSQSSSSSAGITEGKGTTKQTRQSVERLVADALAADHLERLRQDLELADGSDAGRSNRQLSRLLAETIGRIGRARWEYERKGKGRMACWKIKLVDESPGSASDHLEHNHEEATAAGLRRDGMPSQGTIPAAESQSQSQLVHETPMLDMCFDESQAQIAVINNQFDGLGGSMHGGDFFRQDDESLIIESDQELDARSEYSQSARSSPRRDPPGNSADLILEDDEMLEDKDEDFLHHLSPPGATDHIAPDASPYDMASPLENDTSFREDHDEDDMLHDDADTGFGVSASRSFRLTLDDELESRLSSRDYSQNPETPPASLQIRYPESQHPQQGRFDSPSLRMEAFAIHDPCHLPYGTSPRKPQSLEHDSAPYPYHEMPQHLEMEIDDFELELGESDGLVMSLS